MAKTPRKDSDARRACPEYRHALDDRARSPIPLGQAGLDELLRSLTRRVYATDTSASPTA